MTSKHRRTGNSRALIVGDTERVVKIIARKQEDGTAGGIRLHRCGPWVAEQLGQGYIPLATVDEVAHFVQPHLMLSELFGESVLAMTGRSLHG